MTDKIEKIDKLQKLLQQVRYIKKQFYRPMKFSNSLQLPCYIVAHEIGEILVFTTG